MTEHDLLKETILPCGITVRIVAKPDTAQPPVISPGVVTVIDDRFTGNPSFCILASYKIVRRRKKRQIVETLIAYDRETPTDPPWKRTPDSLLTEWEIHNIAYRLGAFRRSTRDVDLDNLEQGKGWRHFFVRGFMMLTEKIKRCFKRK